MTTQRKVDDVRDLAVKAGYAAYSWWAMRRPVSFTLRDHLENPTINTATPEEENLALAVADLARAKTSIPREGRDGQ